MTDKRPSFTQACRTFFGFQPDQKLSGFAAEIKALSHKDKVEIADGLRKAGIDCDDPMPATV